MRDNKHTFALYFPDLFYAKDSKELSVGDKQLIQRMVSILRLKQNDEVIFFDRVVHCEVILKDIHKKNIACVVREWKKNRSLKPHITVLLPLLKREALDTALYSCTALGANVVQLITTEKTRAWSGQKEFDRLERIVIAAAEQSKNFSLPVIKAPLSLEQAVVDFSGSQNIFADVAGDSLPHVIASCDMNKQFVICIGPEGDLTTSEKEVLKKTCMFSKLTPTILKSEQALALLLGTLRLYS